MLPMNFTHFYENVVYQGYFHWNLANGPKNATNENSRLDTVFIVKQLLYCYIHRKNTFKRRFCHRIRVFPMIITVCTLLYVLQLIKWFKLHVVQQRKLSLFSRGNID